MRNIFSSILLGVLSTSTMAVEPPLREVCMLSTEGFPDARARNLHPDYEFSDFTGGQSIGYLGIILIDHTQKKIEYHSVRADISEFSGEYKCLPLSEKSNYSK